MSVFLKASKTDVYHQGHTLVITGCPSPVCAVTAMRNYFLAAHPRRPLFSFQSGLLLTRSAAVHLLQDVSCHAGLPYTSFKGHSFCMGAASTAAAAGLPDWLIKVLGQWLSDCYQLYIRTPCNVLLSATPRMAVVSLHRLIKNFVLGWINAQHVSVAVKSHSDFLKLCFFMLCNVTLFICRYSCLIQHVPAESASAGEIRRLELVFTAHTLSIIA